MKHSHLPSHKAGPFEFLVYVVSVFGPLTTIPQIWKIFMTGNASDISFTTWFAGTVMAGIWLIYGIREKEMPIIIANLLWFILNGIVVVQIFYY